MRVPCHVAAGWQVPALFLPTATRPVCSCAATATQLPPRAALALARHVLRVHALCNGHSVECSGSGAEVQRRAAQRRATQRHAMTAVCVPATRTMRAHNLTDADGGGRGATVCG